MPVAVSEVQTDKKSFTVLGPITDASQVLDLQLLDAQKLAIVKALSVPPGGALQKAANNPVSTLMSGGLSGIIADKVVNGDEKTGVLVVNNKDGSVSVISGAVKPNGSIWARIGFSDPATFEPKTIQSLSADSLGASQSVTSNPISLDKNQTPDAEGMKNLMGALPKKVDEPRPVLNIPIEVPAGIPSKSSVREK